ncbi:TetR/AcrR family transcriptional regulator [Sphingomonas hengshuiensis]|uniref:TetR family transcriptional regulator n=1 Tax=Sphingomonas hengshuiensis TaxID=1609977 RepID=A0A7U4LFG0_9SPHN|nr:TetR/AcrR family transcriptional regulator [Sphingomonas hengshuiensis]AJP72238.1 TetR family transcriptional regulator [Sphingomonas hengshuiensis]
MKREDIPKDRPRDPVRTRGVILSAAKDVLAERGFATWGVNVIARASGYDKQMIYRHFGGMDGLAEAVGEDVAAALEAALSARAYATPPRSYAELMSRLAIALLDALRGNRLAQRILAWELADPGPLATRFATARDRALSQWITREKGTINRPPGVDAPMLNVFMIAGVQQLVLAAASSGRFLGIDLRDEAGWERARAGIAAMAEAIYRG